MDEKLEHSLKPNGYRPRSWGDLIAIATLLAMLVSVVAWGLKLEGELNEVRNQLMTVQSRVGHGILPRAEERINALIMRVEDLEEKEHEH